VSAPASKSMMQRAVATAILARGRSVLKNYTPCNDSDAAIRVARDFGMDVAIDGTDVIIQNIEPQSLLLNRKSPSEFKNNVINCGESGLALRMFASVASLCDYEITLTGEGSLKYRPVSILEDLRQLGVDIRTNNGFIPVSVTGPLTGGKALIDGSLSSQALTGLLIALPCTSNDSILLVKNLTSKPYIGMTLQVMKAFGVEASHEDYKTFTIKGNQKYQPTEYNVEGDWSGASFLLVAGAIGGGVIVKNLDSRSLQADTAILKALKAAGAEIRINGNSVTVLKSSLNPFEFDATNCPDLFPPLVALASYCKGSSSIKGVDRLRYKESDRAKVLRHEFENLGTRITINGDRMIIEGGTIKGGCVHSNNDHRIAMAAAIAGIAAPQPVVIENSESVAKSYPGFYDDLKTIGTTIGR
jgi:3-phosphoshikimate 1-carboxyvinyltransferase